jgi:parallel beta-helix repeat protein
MRGRRTLIAVLSVFMPIILISTAGAQNASPQGPIAISECRKINQPGSYRLVANLTAEGNCLVLTADGVAIDLAGFAITGNGTGTAIVSKPAKATGIPQARTVVRNGDISRFALATDLSGTVERLRVTSNTRGISVGVGTVRDNIVQFNESTGIRLADGIVAGNFAVANGTGILVEEAGILTGNQAAGNKIGIDVKGTGSTLIGNIADGNTEIGMRVACPSNLTNNTAIGNGRNLVLTGKMCRNDGNVFGP